MRPGKRITLRDELGDEIGAETLDAALAAVAGFLTPPNGVSGVEIAIELTPTMPDLSASPTAAAVEAEVVKA